MLKDDQIATQLNRESVEGRENGRYFLAGLKSDYHRMANHGTQERVFLWLGL
jgi:hypothetical protein